jgi:Icc-related predicted phosphoesterase
LIHKLTPMHTVLRHQQSLAWLQAELKRGDSAKTVVVTHNYPHKNSTARRWTNEPLTAAFGSKLSTDILTSASLWIHGHTHNSCGYRIGDSKRSVRVACNPRGYPVGWLKNEFENPAFKPGLLVQLAV